MQRLAACESGDEIAVIGEIQPTRWMDGRGVERTGLRIVAEEVFALADPSESDPAGGVVDPDSPASEGGKLRPLVAAAYEGAREAARRIVMGRQSDDDEDDGD